MTDSILINDEQSELKKTANASDIIESKLLGIIRENCISGIPLDKGTAIKIVCNKFRLNEKEARKILLSLDKDRVLRFGKRRVSVYANNRGAADA